MSVYLLQRNPVGGIPFLLVDHLGIYLGCLDAFMPQHFRNGEISVPAVSCNFGYVCLKQ